MDHLDDIVDRFEIEALRGEFTDAAMMRDYDRLATLFTPDGALRMPNIPAQLEGHDQIRGWGAHLPEFLDFLVQNTHPGIIRLDGDTATGRAYMQEIGRALDGRQGVNFAIYHDRYQRTEDGWKFSERVYEVRYEDNSPLTGAPPGRPSTVTFTEPASEARLDRAAAALKSHGFNVEILDDVTTARERIKDLIPEGAGVFTASSETLRLSGIDADLNDSGRYQSLKSRTLGMDRVADADEIWRLVACPEYVVGSVAAVTETGSLVAASASGSQIPAYVNGATRAIWIVGAQKVVPDLNTALRRIEEHAYPLENDRAQKVYGGPSAINRLLILNGEHVPGTRTVLLLREAIGF
jgi:ketosteroid isomerase-like protein